MVELHGFFLHHTLYHINVMALHPADAAVRLLSFFCPYQNAVIRHNREDKTNAKIVSIWYGLGNTNRKQVIMKKDNKQSMENTSNTVKNPDEWTTGGEEMTGAQQSYLTTLAQEAGEEVEDDLTKAEASKKIDELQHKTGRGIDR